MRIATNSLRLEILRIRTQRGNRTSVKWTERLWVDEVFFSSGFTIDYRQLVKSLRLDGEFYFLTCGCGEPGCSGIWRGIEVHHAGGLVHWHVHQPEPEREFVFLLQQYRGAISGGLNAARKLISGSGDVPFGPLWFTRDSFEACVRAAEEAAGR